MRIVGGNLRGLKLADIGAGDPAAHLRPTTDRVRESIFNLLINGTHGNPIPGARVLDLFAGTGALGLEALSRGAARCIFVEQDAPALRALRGNVAALGAEPQCDVRAASVLALGPAKEPLDLILMDPPYGSGAGAVALDKLQRHGWIGPATWISLETAVNEEPLVKGLEVMAERKVGKARLTLFRMPDAPG